VFHVLVEKLGVAPAHLLYVGHDTEPDIDGALVGGACLKAASFIKIVESAE